MQVIKPDGSDTSLPIEDPMKEMFGPASGTLKPVQKEDEMPEDIRALFESHGLFGKTYKCMLKEIDTQKDGKEAWLEEFVNTYPNPDYLGLHFGPGTYKLIFMWRGKDDQGEPKNFGEPFFLKISDKYYAKHKQFKMMQRINQAKMVGERIREAKIENDLENDLGGFGKMDMPTEKQSAKEFVKEHAEMNQLLGLGTPQKSGGGGFQSTLSALVPVLPAAIAAWSEMQASRRQEQNQLFMLMLSQNSGSNDKFIQYLMSQQQSSNGSDIMKEMAGMFMQALDIKQTMAEATQKESIADKVFGMLETVAPKIAEIAAARSSGQMSPIQQMEMAGAKAYVENNPDIKAMTRDPQEMTKFVREWDAHYGWEQTDGLLQVAGIIRPENCPRNPEQQYPADQREARAAGDEAQEAEFTTED